MEEMEALLFSGNYFDNFQYRAIFVSNHTGLSVNYLHKKAITPKWQGVMAIHTKHYETKDQDGRGRKHGQY